ncbi:MerR family DNA-binding transcriptional regulator [Moorena producens]
MKYLRPRRACEILGVSEKTLRNWEQAGKIKAKCI